MVMRRHFHQAMEMESNEDYHRSPSPGSKHDKEKVVIEVNNGVKKRVSIIPSSHAATCNSPSPQWWYWHPSYNVRCIPSSTAIDPAQIFPSLSSSFPLPSLPHRSMNYGYLHIYIELFVGALHCCSQACCINDGSCCASCDKCSHSYLHPKPLHWSLRLHGL